MLSNYKGMTAFLDEGTQRRIKIDKTGDPPSSSLFETKHLIRHDVASSACRKVSRTLRLHCPGAGGPGVHVHRSSLSDRLIERPGTGSVCELCVCVCALRLKSSSSSEQPYRKPCHSCHLLCQKASLPVRSDVRESWKREAGSGKREADPC